MNEQIRVEMLLGRLNMTYRILILNQTRLVKVYSCF